MSGSLLSGCGQSSQRKKHDLSSAAGPERLRPSRPLLRPGAPGVCPGLLSPRARLLAQRLVSLFDLSSPAEAASCSLTISALCNELGFSSRLAVGLGSPRC